MSDETMYEGLKQEVRGMKDPGNILIFVYILLILVLLLFAGLQSARADFQKTKEGTFSIRQHREIVIPGQHQAFSHSHFHSVEIKPSNE